jgi:IMP dehydrogenase/GMP reductase
MVRFLKTKSLYYHDVNLIASKGCVVTRKDVPVERHRIFVAPMAAIIGERFAIAAARCGLSVVLHRFCDIETQVSIFNKIKDISPHAWCAIGLKEPARVEALRKAGCENFLLDVANGYSETTQKYLTEFTRSLKPRRMMAGNIHTATGFAILEHAMQNEETEHYVRVGIGNGAACLTTKEATGFGRGQISEILECCEYKREVSSHCRIIADGGIKTAADAAKAFGAGADFVMMGSYFARAEEAETHVIGDGTYWGGASTKQQELYGGVRRHAEGTVLKISDTLLPLSDLVDNLWMSLASAVSYSGKPTLSDFIGEGVFEIKFSG